MTKAMFLTTILTLSINAQELPPNPAQKVFEAAKILSEQNLSCSTVNDCISLAVLQKPCGGPLSYLVASKLNLKLDQVENLTKLSVELAREYNRENPRPSFCSINVPKKLECFNNICQEAAEF